MKSTIAILFYLNKPKINSKRKVPINVRINVNGRRSEIATGEQIKPEKWNSKQIV